MLTTSLTSLSDSQSERYARQTLLPDFGPERQLRLLNSSVLVIGAGGLGSPVLLYLAAAGVGCLGIADGDTVDLSNLQRQVIHSTPEIGKSKVDSAAHTLMQLNPDVSLTLHREFLTPENIDAVIEPYDFVIDATDNFASKFMINDACVRAGKPFTFGGIWRYCGQLLTVVPGSACCRCLFDSLPEPEGPAGPLGVIPGVIGSLQATEAVKYLAGIGRLLTDTLLTFDALTMTFHKITVPRSPHHPAHCHHN